MEDNLIGDTWEKGLFYATYNKPNSVQRWCPSDSEENYIKTCNIAKKHGNEFPWKPESFNYRFNKYGFRSVEFEPSDKFKILVSGCSFTEGIGLPNNTVWPALLSAMIPNSIVYNLGQGGHSGMYVARSIYKTIDLLKPDLVAVLWPPAPRLEIFTDRGHNLSSVISGDSEFPKYLAEPGNIQYLARKNEIFVNQVCYMASVPLITLDSLSVNIHEYGNPSIFTDAEVNMYVKWSEMCKLKFINSGSMSNFIARDGLHPGYLWQEKVAKVLYEKYLKLG